MIRALLLSLLMVSTANAGATLGARRGPTPAQLQASAKRPSCQPKTIIIVVPANRRQVIEYGGGWFPPYGR